MACGRGAGSSSPVSHAMGDSELPFDALQAMLVTAGVSSCIRLSLSELLLFYPCKRLVNGWLNMRVSIIILLHPQVCMYMCMYMQASRSIPREEQLPWKPLDRSSRLVAAAYG